MKLVYKITYIDDKVEEITCTGFAFNQDQFWVFPLPKFKHRYIRSHSIQSMEQYFKDK